MRYRGICWLLLAFVCFSCLCSPILAAELPPDNGDYIPEGFEEIDLAGEFEGLPDISIQRANPRLRAAESIGWRQMIIYSKQGVSSDGGQNGTTAWSWGEEQIQEYVNKTLVPGYTYSLGWTHTTILSGYGLYTGFSGAVCSDLISLTPGDVIAGSGYTVQLQVIGTGLKGYLGNNSNYLIGIVDSNGELIKTITSKRSTDKTWKSSFSSLTVTYTFPDYQFEATEAMEDVRLVFWAGASGPPSSSGNNYGAFSVKVPNGNQFSVYLKASVVEGSGAGQDDTSGLLAGIIEWLNKIWNGILSIPSAIVNLGTTILNGLKDLFIPSGEDLQATMDGFLQWCNENFPLLALPLNTLNMFISILTLGTAPLPTITFPAFSVGDVVVSAGYEFNFAEIPWLETLIPYIRAISTISIYAGFFKWVFKNIGYIINGSRADFDDGTFDLWG